MDNNKSLEILKLNKVTIKGYPIIASFITSIELYESITQPGITGFIVIRDYQGLQELGGVFANDDIVIDFTVDGDEGNTLQLKYKIITNEGSRYLTKNTYDVMRLGFCSPWLVDGLTRFVSKPFGTVDKPMLISEIVEDLLKECGAEIGFIEPTKQKFENFVTPLWTPYHSIKYLLGFATNDNYSGGYVCWTDLKTGKVNVTSLDYMLKGSLGYYKSFVVNSSNLRYSGRVVEMNIEGFYDSIRMVNTGLPKTDVYGFNFDKKTHTKTDKNITTNVQTRLGKKFPLPNAFKDEKKYTFSNFISLFPPTSETIADDDTKLTDLIDGYLANKYSFLTTDVTKINIQTLGEMNRRVGWKALLEYPSIRAKTTNNEDSTEQKQLKGDYLIREIKHVFSLTDDYKQYITLVSDGFQEFDGNLIEWV